MRRKAGIGLVMNMRAHMTPRRLGFQAVEAALGWAAGIYSRPLSGAGKLKKARFLC
jgi:hypothetical protein